MTQSNKDRSTERPTTLVTGAGLIGQLTAQLLLQRGEHVVLTDIREPRTGIPTGAIFQICDVSNYEALQAVVAEHSITAIAHTAAVLSNGIRANPRLGLHVNFCGTVNVLEIARQHAIRRVVNASSTTVLYSGFGRFSSDPIPEDALMHLISEQPASLYAITKAAGEQLCQHYREHYDVSALSLRFAAVIGGDLDNPTSVPGKLMATLLRIRNGEEINLSADPLLLWGGVEEFVDARDCARAIVHALDARTPDLATYNIAYGELYRFAEFVEAFSCAKSGAIIQVPPLPATGFAGFAHQRPAESATEAASRELNFQCKYSLEDAMKFWLEVSASTSPSI